MTIIDTPDDAVLRIGQTATITDGLDNFTIQVNALRVAPESIYSQTSLKKSDGTVYFLDFTVGALQVNPTYFGTDSINGLFLRPLYAAGASGKRLYGSEPGCTSTTKQLQPGDTAPNCYAYQIPGAPVTSVTYDDISSHHIVWK